MVILFTPYLQVSHLFSLSLYFFFSNSTVECPTRKVVPVFEAVLIVTLDMIDAQLKCKFILIMSFVILYTSHLGYFVNMTCATSLSLLFEKSRLY